MEDARDTSHIHMIVDPISEEKDKKIGVTLFQITDSGNGMKENAKTSKNDHEIYLEVCFTMGISPRRNKSWIGESRSELFQEKVCQQ